MTTYRKLIAAYVARLEATTEALAELLGTASQSVLPEEAADLELLASLAQAHCGSGLLHRETQALLVQAAEISKGINGHARTQRALDAGVGVALADCPCVPCTGRRLHAERCAIEMVAACAGGARPEDRGPG